MDTPASRPALPVARHACLAFLCLALGAPAIAADITLADAIARTLADQPGIKVQRENVRSAEGAVQVFRGQFDPALFGGFNLERRDTPVPPYRGPLSPLRNHEDTAFVGFAQQFRSGIILEPRIGVLDISDNTTGYRRVATSDVTVAVTVPLLRGAGRASTAARERAAEIALAAQQEAARFAIEGRVFATVNAYWAAAGAADVVRVLRDTHTRGREFANAIDKLRGAGLVERSSAEQATAQMADYERQISSAEAALQISRVNLGLAIGLSPSELATPPSPAQSLPAVPVPPDRALGARYIAIALASRGDHRAALQAIEQARVLLAKAERDIRPQLDLTGTVGYSGGSADADRFDRYGSSLHDNREGPNGGIGLTLGWPVRNDAARGVLVQQRAALRTAELNADLSAQAVSAAVLTAWESLLAAIREHALASTAEERLTYAAARERERAQAGESSIIDVISIEERLLVARLARVVAQQRHAITLAQLRLLTGSLAVPGEENAATFNLAQLSTLPPLP